MFGEPDEFITSHELRDIGSSENPWVRNFAKLTNTEQLQSPIFYVQEYGLNMQRMVGIITQLINERKNINAHLATEVSAINKEKNKRILEISKTGIPSYKKSYDLVIDASGRSIAMFEESIDSPSPRFTDIKLAGLFSLNLEKNKDICKIPEIYILGGAGEKFRGQDFMSHFSPLNPGVCVINITHESCTYVKGGKVQAKNGHFPLTNEAKRVLQADPFCIESRLNSMISHLGTRHPQIAKALKPITGIPGSVNVLGGEIGLRDSQIKVGKLDNRYISLNLSKGSASVRVAENLSQYIFHNQEHYEILVTEPQTDVNWSCFYQEECQNIIKKRYVDDGILDPNYHCQY